MGLGEVDTTIEWPECKNESTKIRNKDQSKNLKVMTMKDEYDFSKGVRGKFYKPGMRLIPPVRIEPQVMNFLADRAQAKGTTINELLNTLLKKDIELIEAA
jgi:hypothetical protein